MGKSSLYDNVLARLCLPLAVRTNGTTNGTVIDKQDPSGGVDSFTTCLFLVIAGAITDGVHTVTIQDSDDGSSFATAAAADVFGGPPSIAASSGDSHSMAELGYNGLKRYLRVSVTVTGATTGGAIGAAVVLGGETSTPVKR
jgi:hypothetical protein